MIKEKFLLIYVLLTIFCGSLLAQTNHRADRLIHTINTGSDNADKMVACKKLLTLYNGVYGEEALTYCHLLITLSEAENKEHNLAYGYELLGDINWFLGNKELAAEAYEDAVNSYTRATLRDSLMKVYPKLSELYIDIGNLQKAIEYQQAEVELNDFFDHQDGVAFSKRNLAILQLKTKNYTQARKSARESQKYFESIHDTIQYLESSNILLDIILEKKDFEYAVLFIDSLLKKIPDDDRSSLLLIKKGKANKGLGNAEGMLTDYKKALQYAENKLDTELTANISKLLCATYEESEDYKNALYYQKKYQQARESLITRTGIEAISAIENQIRLEMSLAERDGTPPHGIYSGRIKKELYIIALLLLVIIIMASRIVKTSRKLDTNSDQEKSLVSQKLNHLEFKYSRLKHQHDSYRQFSKEFNGATLSFIEFLNQQFKTGKGQENINDQVVGQLQELLYTLNQIVNSYPDQNTNALKKFSIEKLVDGLSEKFKGVDIDVLIDGRLYKYYEGNEKHIEWILSTLLEAMISYFKQDIISLKVTPSRESLNMITFNLGINGKTHTEFLGQKYSGEKANALTARFGSLFQMKKVLINRIVSIKGGALTLFPSDDPEVIFLIQIPLRGL